MQREFLKSWKRDVVVGSSFGGAVVQMLIQEGDWKGKTLLIAPALGRITPLIVDNEYCNSERRSYVCVKPISPSPGRRIIILHGSADETIPIELSKAYLRIQKENGNDITLHTVEGGDHRLRNSLDVMIYLIHDLVAAAGGKIE